MSVPSGKGIFFNIRSHRRGWRKIFKKLLYVRGAKSEVIYPQRRARIWTAQWTYSRLFLRREVTYQRRRRRRWRMRRRTAKYSSSIPAEIISKYRRALPWLVYLLQGRSRAGWRRDGAVGTATLTFHRFRYAAHAAHRTGVLSWRNWFHLRRVLIRPP